MNSGFIDFIVRDALMEDLLPEGKEGLNLLKEDKRQFLDVTTEAVLGAEERKALIIAKSGGILSGTLPCIKVFQYIDPGLSVDLMKKDGEGFLPSEKIVQLKGNVTSILKGERTALNFLGHLSGIASETNKIVRILRGTGIKILDTRKTLPGLRILEKQAVVHGGGQNHRMGLYDMVLIKDNHIDAAGSITKAVNKVRSHWGDRYKIEVETRTLEEVKEAHSCRVERIMLDNMKRGLVKRAVELVKDTCEIEVSGNMDIKKIKTFRKMAIDYISAGYLTYASGHSDFSLKILKD